MSSGEYYGGGYGGYGQQQYPGDQYGGQQGQYGQQQGYGGQGYSSEQGYSGGPPPASYGETLTAQHSQHSYGSRPHSPYEDGSYNAPPPGPGPGPMQGQYVEPYPGEQQRYSPHPPANYSEQQTHHPPGPGYQQTYEGYAPPQGPPPPGIQQQQPGDEGERGFLGALAGGAAGAYGGHKVHHGVLGTLGGAVAGSMMEDHFKHKKDDDAKHHQQQQHVGGTPLPPPPPHSGHHHGGGGNFAGNFSASSTQMSLDRDYDLIASCGDVHGGQRLSSVSLNECLGNEWGRFRWTKGGNFAASARNVRLVEGGRVLEAELGAGDGSWKHARVYLDERITNDNGELRFLERG